MQRHLFLPIISLVLLTAAAVSVSCSPTTDTIPLQVGDVVYTVEVAKTREERARGLMNRKNLKPEHGMLFVFPRDGKLSFWMKNTSIPLSIAYITKDGTIKEIFDMSPFSEKSVRSTYSVRYALEVNQGEFEKLGIGPGDTVILPENF